MKIRAMEYRDFSEKLHQKLWQSGKPAVCQMELTFRCNHRCVYCYVPNEHLKGNFQKDELTYSEIRQILNDIYDEGTQWICFTGGDPLMRDDFLKIYTYAKKKGFFITLFTNGGTITTETADYLARFRPFSMEITLNSVNQETFEAITRIPGSYDKVMNGIRILSERKLPLKTKTKAMSLNHEELGKIKEFVEGLGLKFLYNPYIYPKLDCDQAPLQYRLSPNQILSLNFEDNLEEEEIEDRRTESQASPRSDDSRLYRCPIATWTFHINPYGELHPCTYIRQPSYNLKKGSFKEAYRSLFPKYRSATFKTDSKCKSCNLSHLCQWCPGRAYLEKGDPETPIEYFCELAHKRAKKQRKHTKNHAEQKS